MTEQTVHLDVTIEIDTEGVIDTGVTVADWNAMTDADRAKIVGDIWLTEASSHDQGGMSVITDGAEGI